MLRDYLEKRGIIGVYADGTSAETVAHSEKMAQQESARKEQERKKKRYCPNCKKSVEVRDASYSYDDGWFTRIILKCTHCDQVLFEEVEQN